MRLAKSLEKTMTKKTKEVPASQRELPSTPELELKILEAEFARVKKALSEKREQLAPKIIFENAFDYEYANNPRDVVKGLFSIAYLLDSISELGNEEVEGPICNGLAYALKRYAGNVKGYLAYKGDADAQ
jgi:hypothetical protein